MKRYKPLFEKQQLFEWTYSDEKEYLRFCEYVIASNYGELLIEWKLFPDLKEKIEFIKELAIQTGFKIKDLFKLFMNKVVFKFFKLIGWSMTNLFDLLKKGYKAYQTLQSVISEYISNTKVGEWTKKELEKLDKYLEKHPKVKQISGIVVAGLLVYIWLTMTFTGDFLDDFDISLVFLSLTGKTTLSQIFGTPSGMKMLTLFATGALFGLSFPWPGNNIIKFSVAVITTIAKFFKQHLSKGKESEETINKEIKAIT